MPDFGGERGTEADDEGQQYWQRPENGSRQVGIEAGADRVREHGQGEEGDRWQSGIEEIQWHRFERGIVDIGWSRVGVFGLVGGCPKTLSRDEAGVNFAVGRGVTVCEAGGDAASEQKPERHAREYLLRHPAVAVVGC